MARVLLSVYEGILTLARIEHDPERVRHLTRDDALASIGVREAGPAASRPGHRRRLSCFRLIDLES